MRLDRIPNEMRRFQNFLSYQLSFATHMGRHEESWQRCCLSVGPSQQTPALTRLIKLSHTANTKKRCPARRVYYNRFYVQDLHRPKAKTVLKVQQKKKRSMFWQNSEVYYELFSIKKKHFIIKASGTYSNVTYTQTTVERCAAYRYNTSALF